MMTFYFGFSMIYLLSRIFSYNPPIIDTFFICLLVYVGIKLFLKNKHIRWATTLGGVLAIALYGIYLYRVHRLLEVIGAIVDFLKIYGLSLSTGTIFIEGAHITFIVVIMSIFVYLLLIYFLEKKEIGFIWMLLFNLSLIFIGYLYGSLIHIQDRLSVNMIISVIIIYYFHRLSTTVDYESRTRKGFVRSGIVVTAFLLVLANVLYQVIPNPFYENRGSSYVPQQSNRNLDLKERETNWVSVDIDREKNKIEDSFEHNNTLLMVVESEKVDYLKTDAYEKYVEGEWFHDDERHIGMTDRVQNSDLYNSIDYENYYYIDHVKVTYKNIITNGIFVSTYGSVRNRFDSEQPIYADENTGIYYVDEPLPVNFEYEFDGIAPRYGSRELIALIMENEYREGFEIPIDDGIDESIIELAREITLDEPSYYQKALLIEQYLKNNYSYDEKPYIDEKGEVYSPINDDKVVEFLFYNKKGFCQHFASSMVLMLKGVGVEARYVTGFRARRFSDDDEFDDFNMTEISYNILSIYDSNAHAWVEAYFPEVGWIMFEPTPGMAYFLDDGYSSLEQKEAEKEENLTRAPLMETLNVKAFSYYLIGVLIIGFIMVIILLIIRYRKRSNEWKIKKLHRIILNYQRLRHIKKYDYETHREYAIRFDKAQSIFIKASFEPIIYVYEGLLYGNKSISDKEVKVYQEYLKGVKRGTRRYDNILAYSYLRIKELFIWVVQH